jgi:hypothetical protein
LKLSQRAAAERAGLHLQSLGKIEAGRTARLNAKSKAGLSRVLGIPEDYLEAAGRGLPVAAVQEIKICPRCWTAGTEADPYWLDRRALFCFICGTPLRDRCQHCHQPLPSLKFKFCPFCGQAYQESVHPSTPRETS